MLNKDKVYYLASPYSHKSRRIVTARYKEQQRLLAHLTKDLELMVIAPIEMCHNVAKTYGLPGGYAYWKKRDRTFIERSDGIIVCTMDGWDVSIGVTDEILYAKSLHKEVYYLDPQTLEIIEDEYISYVSETDFNYLLDILENPPEPTEALTELMAESNPPWRDASLK